MTKMTTQIGVFLRKLRIDRGEVLYDMAKKMNCSSAFISALELGKRKITNEFRDKLCDEYALTSAQREEFDKAISLSKGKVEIDLSGLNQTTSELLIAFARKASKMNKEESLRLQKFLTKETSNSENGKNE